MALVIRLRRHGSRKRPFYRIVVADSRSPRDGRCVAQIGTYDPSFDPPKVQLQRDQAQRWIDSAVALKPIVQRQKIMPRSNAVPSNAAETAPTQRDRHLQLIAGHGRMNWQKISGYNYRALVEADISRYKRMIGDALRSRTDARRDTEVAVAVRALNRMLELGRPEYVRTA